MENERSLKSLLRAMTLARGRFSLILAHCNYSSLRSQMMQQLHQQETLQVREIVLSKAAQTLFTAIKTELGDAIPQALVISGLEAVENLDTLLLATNQVRDEFSKSLACPLVLWVTNEVLTQLVRLAPDFYSWASSPISFQPSSSELRSFLRQQADRAFAESLHPHHLLPIDDLFRYQLSALPRRHEVEAALRDLQTQNSALQPDLMASLQFLFGQADYAEDNVEQAIEKYHDSLTFWRQANDLERQGAALLYLGLCSLRWAEIDAAFKVPHLEAARTYFQDCLAAFESTNRRDLKAKFTGYQGEILKGLSAWVELQTLVQEAQDLHHIYPSPVEQAKANGLLSEIALWHLQDYPAASRHAQAALQSLESAAISPPPSPAKYWVLLAEAQHHLNQPHEAMRSLEQARNQISSQDNPHLYIHILERLRTLYFEQKQYEKAFQFKREQLSIESQYGLRAFIGAGRLQSHRQLRSSAPNTDTIAQEIAVSGRQQDVNRLLERVSRDDCKLTILHGQLGVGKSSLIQAGLIPTLEPEPIKARDVVVVLLRSYSNWVDKLGEKLGEQTQKRKDIPITIPHSPATLLQQLSNNDDRNFLSVLILDQFEEFFFSCPHPHERQAFFKFLSACLEIPFIKIILSLREDYLHYLLEWEHYDDLKPINDNILSKDHRYELRNFSSEDTRRIIQGLTNRSHLTLEEALVNQLVQDLTGETGEIRPIELQVVGAQLHEEKIRTFEQYRLLGDRPKETLVQNYLEGVIRDCGAENENAARLVLYLLTGENNTRPSKTRDELETDLKALEKDLLKEAQKLDLVLEIFRQSGLVFLLPETPADRYQLVHDYLVAFIRKQQPRIDELVKELEIKRKQLEETEKSLKIAQLEKGIAEEQEKFAKESQKRVEAELTLEKGRKTRLLLYSILFAISSFAIVSMISQSQIQNKNDEISSFLDSQYRSTLDSYSNYATDLVYYGNSQAALVEMLKACTLLRQRYSFDEQTFKVEDPEETSKKIIRQMQKTISKAVSEKNIRPAARADISRNLEKLKAEELNALLNRLLDIGCTHVQKDELEHRKWEAPLCEKYQQ
jgi:hypothetical protein